MLPHIRQRYSRCAWGLAAPLLLVLAGMAGVPARADDVDESLGAVPTYSAPAPVPIYAPDLDETNGRMSGPGYDPVDAPSRQVEADIDTLGYVGLDFVALILDRDATDNLYIKVQQQSPYNGKFTHVGFYHGTSGGWTGMTGGTAFFALDPADYFETAHMTVIHDGAGNVTLRLTNIDGGGKVLEFSRGGWVPRNSNSGGFGGYDSNFAIDNWGMGDPIDYTCDNFNRANGALGANWVTTDGTGTIVGNTARGGSGASSRSIFVGSCLGGIGQQVEADVSVVSTTLDYCALVLNWDGVDNLYVKVQRQAGTAGTAFTHVGIYDSVNGSSWPGQTGGPAFFALPTGQTFTTAHMRVTVDGGGTVRLILTEINGGTGMLEFQRGGWPFRNGDGAGYGGYANNNRIDNWSTGGVGICDTFNRANGSLGSGWTTTNGTASIINKAARGNSTSRSIFVGTCGDCFDTTPPVVDITAPASFACGCLNITISGTANDPDGEYLGDVFEYRRSDQVAWTVGGTANTPRTGTLYTWNTAALTEGYYYVRVTGRNECNVSASDDVMVRVNKNFDTVDFRSPPAGAILGGTVCVDGTAYENNCFDYYTVMYRPAGGGVFNPVDPTHPTYTTTVINDPLGSWNTASGPTAVPDGDYQIRVLGMDTCGYSAEQTHTVRIDNTAPIATLSGALQCDSVSGVVEIRGTASDANIASWALMYTGGDQHGWVTIASGNASIVNGVLANWDTSRLRKCAYTLRLTVVDRANVSCSGDPHQTDYYASVGVGWYIVGDMNCDGLVDFNDINPFVACLSSGGNCTCP
ncbi:MAG: hypothetical protein AB1716_09055 [Planctomycetota bacterium]